MNNFYRITRRVDPENVRFHGLRHTFTSLILHQRAKPKVVYEALAHSSAAFTIDVYSHIIERMGAEVMALLDEVLPAEINGIRKNNGKRRYDLDLTSDFSFVGR